jgi:hypothetical protein
MTMVVVARPLDLPQAQVAASALRSAGLNPVLLDEMLSHAYWHAMFAFGGCRVAVPQAEVADAIAILEHAPQPVVETLARADRIDPLGWGWRWAAGLASLLLLMGPDLGWLVLCARSRQRGAGGAAMGMAVTLVGCGLILGVTFAALALMFALANPHGPY